MKYLCLVVAIVIMLLGNLCFADETRLKELYSQYGQLQIQAQTVKDMEGKDVQIPQSLGHYSLESLEAQKASIQEKIDAIKALEG